MSKNIPAKVNQEDLMRFLDGEVSPEKRAEVERFLETSSELRREVALFRSMKEELQDLSFANYRADSVWDRIRSRITQPVGWILTITGTAAWLVYGAWSFVRSPSGIVVKLATGGVAIGILVLLANVIWDRYRAYGTDPYRNVQQ